MNPSVLNMNDDCLMAIFRLLPLPGLIGYLKEVKIDCCRIDISEKRDSNGNIMANHFQFFLETVHPRTSPNVPMLCEFPNLEKMDLSCSIAEIAEVLQEIVVKLKPLEKFTVKGSYNLGTLDCLTKMRRINTLSLTCPFDDVSIFLNKMVSLDTLQCLRLTQVLCSNRLVATIGKFSNLRELEIDAFESIEQQLDLQPLGQLGGLRNLTMGGSMNFNQQDLVRIVNNLVGLMCLKINSTQFSMNLESRKIFGRITNRVVIVTDLGTKVRNYFTGRYVGLMLERDGSGCD